MGGIPFLGESRFGRNSVLGGNPVSGGIPFWEEFYGRSPVLGGVPVGNDPGWEEFRARIHMGGVLYGRNPNGTKLSLHFTRHQ